MGGVGAAAGALATVNTQAATAAATLSTISFDGVVSGSNEAGQAAQQAGSQISGSAQKVVSSSTAASGALSSASSSLSSISGAASRASGAASSLASSLSSIPDSKNIAITATVEVKATGGTVTGQEPAAGTPVAIVGGTASAKGTKTLMG